MSDAIGSVVVNSYRPGLQRDDDTNILRVTFHDGAVMLYGEHATTKLSPEAAQALAAMLKGAARQALAAMPAQGRAR
jgi:hypothetical protein